MKRKLPVKTAPVVPAELLEQAKRAISADRLKKVSKCTVCGSEAQGPGPEALCWVCRRLKISAWRDLEQQISAQE